MAHRHWNHCFDPYCSGIKIELYEKASYWFGSSCFDPYCSGIKIEHEKIRSRFGNSCFDPYCSGIKIEHTISNYGVINIFVLIPIALELR